MEEVNERVWIVIQDASGEGFLVSAFDNEADASNYFMERKTSMGDRHDGSLRMSDTLLMRRDMMMPRQDLPWGMMAPDLNKEFVEGLLEEYVPDGKFTPDTTERFLKDKKDDIYKRAQAKFNDYIRDELHVCVDEWCKVDMEY